MSSLANSVKRKTHKERSQPAARQKFGLLEKKKDYVQRAKDFHKKEKTIKNLQRKAEARNPDEFYFAMEKSKTKGGVHDGSLTVANKYSQQELRLMKTQDVKYVSMKHRAEENKVERMKANLHFIGIAPSNKHVVFVEDAAAAKSFNAAEYFDTPAELMDRTFNRPRKALLAAADAVSRTAGYKKIEKKKYASYKELGQRSERAVKVGGVAAKMAYDKEVMGKGRKRKLATSERHNGGTESEPGPALFKWKQIRKK